MSKIIKFRGSKLPNKFIFYACHPFKHDLVITTQLVGTWRAGVNALMG